MERGNNWYLCLPADGKLLQLHSQYESITMTLSDVTDVGNVEVLISTECETDVLVVVVVVVVVLGLVTNNHCVFTLRSQGQNTSNSVTT